MLEELTKRAIRAGLATKEEALEALTQLEAMRYPREVLEDAEEDIKANAARKLRELENEEA